MINTTDDISFETQAVNAFQRLKDYCEEQDFKGWDPYDGLNSRLFQSTPLKNWDLARLALIQICKRSPFNLRPILGVPKEHNAKGIGLFLNGYANLLRSAQEGDDRFGTVLALTNRVRYLADLLLTMRTPGYSGACWGYNFDWQARRLFYFPTHTPTVVATSFCASALFNASRVTGDERLAEIALSSGDFILKDLARTECKGGFLFSYSPIPGNDTVYNAALLGAKTLSQCFEYTGNAMFKDVAREVVSAVCSGQEEDGSWVYGLLPIQSWKDSFHTGYNLEALAHYRDCCKDSSFDYYIEKGVEYYVANFFRSDGTPKYYSGGAWPIDIHCPGQLVVTLVKTGRFEEQRELCEDVLRWTFDNMQDKSGFFYYQIKPIFNSKISYMRWSNAFTFNALSYLLHEGKDSRG